MGIRLPWRRLEGPVVPFGPLVAVLAVDLALLCPGALLLFLHGHLTPNEPQIRLNLLLGALLGAACAAWFLLQSRGRATSASGPALAFAGYALAARAVFELVVVWHGADLDYEVWSDLEPIRGAVRFARTFGLLLVAWGLGTAAGEVAAELRGNGPRAGGRAAATRRAGGGVASAGP